LPPRIATISALVLDEVQAAIWASRKTWFLRLT